MARHQEVLGTASAPPCRCRGNKSQLHLQISVYDTTSVAPSMPLKSASAVEDRQSTRHIYVPAPSSRFCALLLLTSVTTDTILLTTCPQNLHLQKLTQLSGFNSSTAKNISECDIRARHVRPRVSPTRQRLHYPASREESSNLLTTTRRHRTANLFISKNNTLLYN